MVTRLLLAVTVAAALLAVSLPAVETVRTDRTTAKLDRTADRVEAAGDSLLATDDPSAGARRVVSVTLPSGSFAAAGVDRFAVSCRGDCAVAYRLHSGASHRHRLPFPLSTPAGAVAFSTPGTHRLTLGLARQDGRRVVTVRG